MSKGAKEQSSSGLITSDKISAVEEEEEEEEEREGRSERNPGRYLLRKVLEELFCFLTRISELGKWNVCTPR